MAQLDTDGAPWVEVATIKQARRGGELITTLLETLAAAGNGNTAARFIYGLYVHDDLVHWAQGPTIPVSDQRVAPFHPVPQRAPGHWLMPSAREHRSAGADAHGAASRVPES